MEKFSLDGFQLLHPNAKSILQEHREARPKEV